MDVQEKDNSVLLPEVIDLTNAHLFNQALQSLYEKDYEVIQVDCEKLKMIDSAGLGSLVLYQKRLKERGRELKIVNVMDDYH